MALERGEEGEALKALVERKLALCERCSDVKMQTEHQFELQF